MEVSGDTAVATIVITDHRFTDASFKSYKSRWPA